MAAFGWGCGAEGMGGGGFDGTDADADTDADTDVDSDADTDGDGPPPEVEDEADFRAPQSGRRYVYAANRTEGLLDSICAEDFSPIVDRLGLTLSGLQSVFALSRVPVLDTLEVSLYADPSDDSKIRDLTIDVDFTYVEEDNTLLFEGDQVPASQQFILAEYRVQSGA